MNNVYSQVLTNCILNCHLYFMNSDAVKTHEQSHATITPWNHKNFNKINMTNTNKIH